MLNTKLLRKVKKHILEEPKRLAMIHWSKRGLPGTQLKSEGWGEEPTRTFPPCGTVGCIAGWACMLSGMYSGSSYEGGDLLGIPDSTSLRNSLFIVEDWPEPIRSEYICATTPERRAKLAAKRINLFIKEHKDDTFSI